MTLVTALSNGALPVLDDPDRVELTARSAAPYRRTALLSELKSGRGPGSAVRGARARRGEGRFGAGATAIEEAIAQGRLVAEGVLWKFRHDLIRQAVYDSLATPVKHAALRREAGSAPHAACGARRGDTQALRILRDTADRIVVAAPGAPTFC
ncbi:hypothetical protein [Streptomyces sp. NPDC004284]|uniref:hypothetical protein n=1 Tax=Streptomyces sp. NPDC004284 TaxID=3364695 RepID=UPI003692D6B7